MNLTINYLLTGPSWAYRRCRDGEWRWTRKARESIPELTRMFLGDLLYGRSSAFAIKNIMANGFNQDGTVRKEAESERIH